MGALLVYEEVGPGIGFYTEVEADDTPQEPEWLAEYDQYWFDYLCPEEEVPDDAHP